MLGYYLRLALKSFARNPGITALMVLAIALGIAVCVMTLTVYHAMSGNPIWWKNDRLYAVTMDNWDPQHPLMPNSDLPPHEMTYKDTQFLFASNIPLRKVVMYGTLGVISGVGAEPPTQIETRVTTAWVLEQILKLLHPFMPFVTEALWANLTPDGERRGLLCLASWPQVEGLADRHADGEIGWLIKLVSEVRSVRNEMHVPAGALIPLVLVSAGEAIRERALRHEETIKRMARLNGISFAAAPKGSAQIVLGETTAALALAGVIDMEKERTRLAREIDKCLAEIKKIDVKLANADFIAKAPAEVVEENRERKVDFAKTVQNLQAALKRVDAPA